MPSKKEHYNAGLDLFGQKKYAEANTEYQKALELDPQDSEIHLALSISNMLMGDLDAALVSGKKAAECNPNDPLVFTNLSRILQKKGMYGEAEDAMALSRQLSM